MTSAYQLTIYNSVVRNSDGATIPFDSGNSDYQAYLAWAAAGNTADPVPAPTSAQLEATNIAAIQAALDTKAQSRGYTDIKSACAYASPTAVVTSTDPNFALCEKFRKEGNALQAWMAITWATAYNYIATVTAGTNPMPTTTQAVAMMSAFTWPD